MLRLLGGLFRRKETDPESMPEERWSADFSRPRRARFPEESAPEYAASFVRGALELRLRKARVFAWVQNPLFRYSDFVAEALVRIPAPKDGESPYAAAGLLFRCSDERSYYSFLVSTKGFFRVDAVFNGSPLPLVGWTETPEETDAAAGVRLRVVALGDRLTFTVDDRWAAELSDGTLSEGRVGFAAASYDDRPGAAARLEAFRIDSRRLEAEAAHYRWNSYVRVDPAGRSRLASTFLSMGQPLSALVQLKRAWRTAGRAAGTQRSPADLLLAAECAMRLSLYPEAEEYLDRCVEADDGGADARRAVAEKAKLLYLSNRFDELREHAAEAAELYPEDATLRTLLGHACWNLGAWEAASAAYEQARELDGKAGLVALNAARARDRLGDGEGAFVRYLEAARAFLRDRMHDDLEQALPRLRELRPGDPAVLAVSGKHAYAREDWETAEAELRASLAAAAPGAEDSAACYLLALLLIRRGKRPEALPLLEKAVSLEAGYAPYRFRLAECRFLLSGDGDDPRVKEDLSAALALAPEDGWTANLAAQVAAARGDAAEAARYAETAAAALPDEPAVLVNRAEIAFLEGASGAALALLDRDDPAGVLANEAGNILVRMDRLEEAEAAYGRALAAAPAEPDFLRNRASCLVRLDRYGEADELLAKLAEIDPGARTLDLIAYVAIKKGEYPRAEAAYRVGLERFPEDKALLAGLAWTYLSMARWQAAEQAVAALEALMGDRNAPAVAELRERLTEATTRRVGCASCGRFWRVPKDAPPAPSFRLVAEPPDELPAGTCARCGKTYCIGCGKNRLADGRFVCPECGERLKLMDEGLKKLVSDWANAAAPK